MTNQEFEKLIDDLLDAGLEITLEKREDGHRWYNLNTMMKSHLEITLIDGECVWQGRYGETGTIYDISDVRRIGRYCMCERDYASGAWHEFMKGD